MSEHKPDDFETRRSKPIKPGEGSRPAADRIPSLKGSLEQTRRSERTRIEEADATVRRPRPDLPPPPPVGGEPPEEPTEPPESGLYVPWWAFAIVILAVAAITCGMWYFVLSNRGDLSTSVGPSPTPIFVIITPTPTLGQAEDEEPEVTATPTTLAPTNTPEPTVAEDFTVGSQVAITGTEGAGLAVRQGPGVEYTYFFVANEGERFVIEEGPREADGYIWWYIADPADPDREGWAAQDWMQIAQAEP